MSGAFSGSPVLALAQFGFDFLRGGECAFESGGQFFNQAGDIAGDADGFGHVPQGVLGDDLVARLAQDQADGWLIVRVAEQVVHSREIEIHLAGVLGFEGLGLQVDHDKAAQTKMIEQQVDIVVLAAHFQGNLLADKGEARAQLQQELADVVEQGPLQLPLGCFGAEGEEVEVVGVLDDLDGQVRLRGWERPREVADGPALPTVQVSLNLVRKNST